LFSYGGAYPLTGWIFPRIAGAMDPVYLTLKRRRFIDKNYRIFYCFLRYPKKNLRTCFCSNRIDRYESAKTLGSDLAKLVCAIERQKKIIKNVLSASTKLPIAHLDKK